jgi:hypothetical protein
MILEAFLPGVLLFLEAYGFLESPRSRLWRTLFLDVEVLVLVHDHAGRIS